MAINQCDGCQAGDPIINGLHRRSSQHFGQSCTANRYKEEQPRLKVKLTATSYLTKSGFEVKKSLYFYKKPNPEHLIEAFEVDAVEEGIYAINNLHLLDSGIYELVVTDITYDWETGHPDSLEWELVEWKD